MIEKISQKWVLEKHSNHYLHVINAEYEEGSQWSFTTDGEFSVNGVLRGSWEYLPPAHFILHLDHDLKEVFEIMKVEKNILHLKSRRGEELTLIPF